MEEQSPKANCISARLRSRSDHMGLAIAVLAWRTPRYIISRELVHVSDLTTAALESLLEDYAPEAFAEIAREELQPSGTIEERRSAMAKKHAIQVRALEKAVGRDKAVAMGRDALFAVGRSLGRETHDKLGMGDTPRDLVRAARIMYRILGIEFRVEWLGDAKAKLIVERCALAKEYSELTCSVLSATDEGVIAGLNPGASMKFEDKMTGGCARCIAAIEFKREGRGT